MPCPAVRQVVAFAAFLTLGIPAESVAQQQPRVSITPRELLPKRTGPRSNLRADVNMILVPLTVTDQLDRPVTDLGADGFRVFEDNVEQKIVSLHREEGPVSVGFLFDASSSMKKRTDPSIAAIEQFIKGTVPADEFFLIRFSDKPSLVTGFTRDSDEILKDLALLQPQGWTALLDAIVMGAHHMKKAMNPRKALFVLTDGGDNNSRYSETEVKNLVVESDVRIYAVGLFERPHFLEKIAAATGGAAFWAHKLEDLPATIERLSRAFRNQYVLGYSSNNQRNDGKYRKLRVELTQSLRPVRLNVFWRPGYYAPPD
jgi:Ca-activated chloride channel family protein